MLTHDHFALDHFEGSLDFLLCLIRKEEIDIYDVPIYEIIQQFISKLHEYREDGLEKGAEFIGLVSYLVWLKSKTLLPANEEPAEIEENIEDPHFEIIHHLLDYCRFKEAAKELHLRQEKQQASYFRGIEIPEWKKPLGIDHISLEQLSSLFSDLVARSSPQKQHIQEENWRVSDKIFEIRQRLQMQQSFSFSSLFDTIDSRLEMVVIFLALLELMKSGEVSVCSEPNSNHVFIYGSKS